MTKIALVANTDWFLYNFRLSLAEAIRAQGNEVLLISPNGEYVEKLQQTGFHWIEWQVGRQSLAPWRELPSFSKLVKVYRREKPDLVHHHTIKAVLYGSMAAKYLGMNDVVNSITGRGYVFLGNEGKAHLMRPLVKLLYRIALKHPNFATTFENEVDRQYFIDQKFVSAESCWLIPGVGVDPQRFLPAPEPTGAPVVLYSGRMLWDKGVGLLVEAARIMKTQTEVRVLLVGQPDPGNPASIPESRLRAWSQEGTVEWLGWQADMNKVYAKCHIVTLPTMYGEGVPTVLLEASACGRPIVASDMPGCLAVITDGVNGLIVPAQDSQALAEGLLRLISDPELRGRMGNAGRQLVLQNFTTIKINAATIAVYHNVLSHSTSKRLGNNTP